MSEIKLNARLRQKTKRQLHKSGIIPAIIYGPNSKNQLLELDYKEFDKIYSAAGESSLIDLSIDNKNPVKVLIRELQRNPVSDKYIHVDFYQLDMNTKLMVEMELIFEGVEATEKRTGAEVIKNLKKIQIESLPKNLIKEFRIDVSQKLQKIGDIIYVKDIQLPEGLSLVTEGASPIASLQQIKEEIIEQPEKEAESTEEEQEGEKEEKKDEADKGTKTEDKKNEAASKPAGEK